MFLTACHHILQYFPDVFSLFFRAFCSNLEGKICMDILKDQWSPALTISKVLTTIQAMMASPELYDGAVLVPEIKKLYEANRSQHDQTAREWTRKYV